MSAAVKITRTDQTANELRRLASKELDGSCVRRLLGIALILEGQTRETAAREAGMERQTLRDWVHRYNAQGLAGLRSIRGSGRSPHLSPAQMAELQALTQRHTRSCAGVALTCAPKWHGVSMSRSMNGRSASGCARWV